MEYKLAIKHATQSACYNDARKMTGQLGIMLHSVGCNQPSADVFANTWNRATATVCGTYACAPGYVVQTLPETVRPWTSGSGANGNANNYMIQVEMTEPASLVYVVPTSKFSVPASKLKDAQKFVTDNYWTAVALFADICKRRNIDPTGMIASKKHPTIISHAEGGAKYRVASAHADPEHLWSQLHLPFTMDTFRRDVKAALGDKPAPDPGDAFIVRLEKGTPYYKAPDGKTAIGAIEVSTNYTIVETVENYGRLKSGAGWVRLSADPKPDPIPTTPKLDAWMNKTTLKQGTKGKHVEVVQAILMAGGYDVREIDGDYGQVTVNAMKAYQKDKGLTADGWVGQQTWEKLTERG